MKKILLIALSITMAVAMMNCNSEARKTSDTSNEAISESVIDSVALGWTGYKTTDKTEVGGVFNEINFEGINNSGTTPEEVLDGATVSIPVSSMDSGNQPRDTNLIDIFFGTMKNTELISGVFHANDGNPTLEITLNGTTQEIPVTTALNNNIYTIDGDVQLENFGALDAVNALAEACFELHKGADGVSKTWAEAHFKGIVFFSSALGQ